MCQICGSGFNVAPNFLTSSCYIYSREIPKIRMAHDTSTSQESLAWNLNVSPRFVNPPAVKEPNIRFLQEREFTNQESALHGTPVVQNPKPTAFFQVLLRLHVGAYNAWCAARKAGRRIFMIGVGHTRLSALRN